MRSSARMLRGGAGAAGGHGLDVRVFLRSVGLAVLEVAVDGAPPVQAVFKGGVLDALRALNVFKARLLVEGNAAGNAVLLRSERVVRELRDTVKDAYVDTFGP